MDAGDAMERGERAPESQGPKTVDEGMKSPLLTTGKKKAGIKAPAVVLGFECLESTAFNGISTNLVVYLETVLHGSNLASASNVTTWFGTSYLTPILGAVIADSFWGNYNTILVSLAVYLIGMLLVTFSAFLPTTATTALCLAGTSCGGGTSWSSSVLISTQTVAFVGLYLVALGSGGVRSSLLPFGAEQFDDDDGNTAAGKASFFSWFYLAVDFGPIVSGVLLVWVQQNVSWGLGFGIATACIALAYAAFVLAAPMFKRRTPTGSPLKSLCQVAVAACRNIRLRLPSDAELLHEVGGGGKIERSSAQAKIAHTDEFRFLDKAAIIVPEYSALGAAASSSPWKLCTVTQVEELKILLRLLPIWATSIVVSSAYSQMNTTFIQQGGAMATAILSVPVPAASMGSFEVLCVLTWVLLYSKVIAPAFSRLSTARGEPSQLQRMGAGRLLMALSMAAAAIVETRRLDGAARGEAVGIAWQLPQYFFLAGGEVFCYIAQLEFFYAEAPDTMKSTCTSLALLTIALGNYMSSLLYAVVAAVTGTAAGSPGWICDDLNKGHLDYFFWTMAAMCTLNFVVYSALAKNYKLKTVLSS